MEDIIPFIFMLSILGIVFNFVKWKTKHNTERMMLKQNSDNSMSSIELKEMIAEAVAEANMDIRAELDELRTEKSGRLSLDDLEHDPYNSSGQESAPRQRL